MSPRLRSAGPIAWMARHMVAPNLLMLTLILGGLAMATQVKQEYLPHAEQDTVTVTIPLPGATPEEVEQSIVLALEEAVRSVQGIDALTATASEGSASIVAELDTGRDRQLTYNDIVQAVDGVTSLPEDAEEPVVTLDVRRREVVELHIFGAVDEMSLRNAAEHLRNSLLQHPEISQVDLEGVRDLEIHIDVSRAQLRAYGLTLSDVASTVAEAALDRAGGTLETRGGDLLLRLADRRDAARDFAAIPLIADRRGTVLRLGDVATIRQGFADANIAASFRGLPSIRVNVFRVGDETPIGVADATRAVLPQALSTLPEAIDAVILNDRSYYFRGRMELLLENGALGLLLVLAVLTLFLELKLAFWVAVGIPTAFLGTLLFLPWLGGTINLVSMFAFILALGIVVDDAIVAGENIYEYRERGMGAVDAAIQGARDIAMPLSFSILTNIVAFIPLALVPGTFGQFWMVIPIVVSLAFLLSWVEALFVLPAHLAGVRDATPKPRRWLPPGLLTGLGLALIAAPVLLIPDLFERGGALFLLLVLVAAVPIRAAIGARGRPPGPGPLTRLQGAFSGGLAWFIGRIYGPALRFAMEWRYATTAAMIAILAITLAWPMSGRMGWGLFPSIPRDYATAVVTMPVGTPFDQTLAVRDRMVAAAERVIAENGGDDLGIGVYAIVEDTQVRLEAHLTPPERRTMPTREFAQLWREAVGPLPAARSVRYEFAFGGPGGGAGIEIQLSHPDVAVLEAAAGRLARSLGEFAPVRDPDDGFTPGKQQLEFRLTEAGRALGLTSEEVARQVRAAFFGIEALTQQDGRNEVTVRVRLPEDERRSEADIETLVIRTAEGGEVPLFDVATVTRSRADARIRREDGRRVVAVTANVEPADETNRVLAAVTAEVLPQLLADFPGLALSLEGRQATQRETMQTFVQFSIPLALVIIYALLAIPFRSYVQPMIVMTAIPFGFAGAVLGHLIMGMSLSIISVFGIIALGGVVINAALVMIDYANKARDAGATPFDAMARAGVRRFRPILLTTLTTFGGLAPMIFETSRQAQFLIPMAVSLGYGIVFATLIVLFLIPCLYLILEDLRWLANPPDPTPKAAKAAEETPAAVAAE